MSMKNIPHNLSSIFDSIFIAEQCSFLLIKDIAIPWRVSLSLSLFHRNIVLSLWQGKHNSIFSLLNCSIFNFQRSKIKFPLQNPSKQINPCRLRLYFRRPINGLCYLLCLYDDGRAGNQLVYQRIVVSSSFVPMVPKFFCRNYNYYDHL